MKTADSSTICRATSKKKLLRQSCNTVLSDMSHSTQYYDEVGDVNAFDGFSVTRNIAYDYDMPICE